MTAERSNFLVAKNKGKGRFDEDKIDNNMTTYKIMAVETLNVYEISASLTPHYSVDNDDSSSTHHFVRPFSNFNQIRRRERVLLRLSVSWYQPSLLLRNVL